MTGGLMEEVREVLERSDPSWEAADSVDSDGQSFLHLAIVQDRPNIVQIILEFGPDLEAQSQSGCSPMEAASEAGKTLIVELLLA
ncbi:hypothetical protein L484_000694 [Morus notabilis]|uniref:Uncharacterized protein n=1 Tax=Morus notabilis TaxID=981085 RepID=W9QNU6_9ROSA|nr:hypothetical protein L484_000694 [Morus notabilis]